MSKALLGFSVPDNQSSITANYKRRWRIYCDDDNRDKAHRAEHHHAGGPAPLSAEQIDRRPLRCVGITDTVTGVRRNTGGVSPVQMN